MAGDWIKMRRDLWTHPRVVRIASALGLPRVHVIGALHGVWSVFDAHSEDGTIDDMDPDALDGLVETPGMSAAMAGVGWLEIDGSRCTLPRYADHNGATAKRRAADARRKRDARSADRPPPVRTDADTMRTRQEQTRTDGDAYGVSTSRSVRASVVDIDGVDVEVIDWGRARDDARAIRDRLSMRGKPRDADRTLLYRVAALRQLGIVPEDAIQSAIESTATTGQRATAGPIAYLTGAIRRQCSEHGVDWRRLANRLEVPPRQQETEDAT